MAYSAAVPVAEFVNLLRTQSPMVLERWASAFEASPLRLHREFDARTYVGLVAPLCDALAVAVHAAAGTDGTAALAPGQPATRDLEQGCAFVGARLATSGAVGFDVGAVMVALRDALLGLAPAALHAPLTTLFEWLLVLALDAYASATRRSVEERAAEQLEMGTPILMVTPALPAVVLVGEPPRGVLDGILARVGMAVVAHSAKALLVDCSGLAAPARPELLAALDRWLASEPLAAVRLYIIGVNGEARRWWTERATARRLSIEFATGFDAAVAAALDGQGMVVRRRA